MVTTPSFKPTYEQNTFKLSPTATTTTLPWNNTSLPTTPLFGTDGIRGKAGELLTAPMALQIGFWAGQVLPQYCQNPGPIIMGQDTRNSGNMLAMALSAGLTAAGLEVWNLGLCPTPCVAYITSISEAIGGVMISASHNPPEDNGIKFFGSDGTKLSSELQQKIESGIRGTANFPTNHSNWGQHYHRPELVKEYQASLHSPLTPGSLQGMKIVLDLAWGAAVHTAPEVFRGMGAEIICLHDQPNGDRINVNCGSTHLSHLQQAVIEHNANLGFAFDGDADRVLAIDSQGRSIDGDYILYFWGQSLSKARLLPNNLIVTTVMANLGFEHAWNKQGGKILRTKVGDQYVHAEMQRTGSMLGGEQSGHVLCPHYGITGDGLMTALHLATLVKNSGISLAELVDQSFKTYPQLLRNVRVEDRDRRANWKNCEPLVKTIEEAETALADLGRVLVRASGTEPVIRVMVEAINLELAKSWTENIVLAVQQHLLPTKD
ncbi:phosphoglucosamine mutase [Trichodesmium erythraeum IMS101]|uniref:Phosphoglucosamine mutase n=1 Tax=Trichodesmium erythraeum (strain IMS101) TaxID=203124 RepID=GLMM_TRIEI|nr:RecName: Full=Phosphoglucosamine mutase [Trichodesmium erythraeum IMS101]MBS9772151.1 phosphoglucosamine mutase [Trichodesmium erythraeum GBRTRLIN201]